jgi:hypothetical protein
MAQSSRTTGTRAFALLLLATVASVANAGVGTGRHLLAAEVESGAPTIQVIEPLKGEMFYRGSNLEVKWRVLGKSGKSVHVYLMRGRTYFMTLAGNTANDGSFSWFIPPGFRPYDFYTVAIAYPHAKGSHDFDYAYSPTFGISSPTLPPSPRPTPRPTPFPTPMATAPKNALVADVNKYIPKGEDRVYATGVGASIVVMCAFCSLVNLLAAKKNKISEGEEYDAVLEERQPMGFANTDV